jgi:hypothetical protein
MRKRSRKPTKVIKLNLVAIIDIFTILVFFLMVSSSGGEVIENIHNIHLPDSISETLPQQTLKILITGQELRVDEQRIDISRDLQNHADILASLHQVLQRHAAEQGALTDVEREKGLAVTVMGDANVPYDVLKKVLATCAQSDYRNVALAVNYQLPMAGS